MDRDIALAVIEQEAARVVAVAELARQAGRDGPVPTCPDWTLQDVPAHLGRVYAMVATVLDGDPDQPVDRSQIPKRPEEQAPVDWMRERLDILLPKLRDVPEDARCWNFAEGPSSPVGFWWRRQAHETLIHRVDVELAAGEPVTSPQPEVAADAIGDFLAVTGFRRVEWDEIKLGEEVTVHLHATDAPGAEWTIDTANRTYATAHLKADIAVRGEAWALDRWCWRRDGFSQEDVGLEFFGDRQAADAWRPTI